MLMWGMLRQATEKVSYDFFESAKSVVFKNSRLTAFGSTHRYGILAEDDKNLNAISFKVRQVLKPGNFYNKYIIEYNL